MWRKDLGDGHWSNFDVVWYYRATEPAPPTEDDYEERCEHSEIWEVRKWIAQSVEARRPGVPSARVYTRVLSCARGLAGGVCSRNKQP